MRTNIWIYEQDLSLTGLPISSQPLAWYCENSTLNLEVEHFQNFQSKIKCSRNLGPSCWTLLLGLLDPPVFIWVQQSKFSWTETKRSCESCWTRPWSQPLSLCLFLCRANVKAGEDMSRLLFHTFSPFPDQRSKEKRSKCTLWNLRLTVFTLVLA